MNNTQKIKTSVFYGSAISLITSGIQALLTNEALLSILPLSASILTGASLAIYFLLRCSEYDFDYLLDYVLEKI